MADNMDREAVMRLIDDGQPRGLPVVSSQLSAFSPQQVTGDGTEVAEASRQEKERLATSPLAFATPGDESRCKADG